jgi:hypothetical protein
MRASRPNRRQLLGSVGALVAGAAAGSASTTGQAPPARLVPREDLVNTLEYEAQARRNLPAAAFAQIAGGDRAAFDRIALHPRHLVPTLDMDLTAIRQCGLPWLCVARALHAGQSSAEVRR